MNIVFIVPTGIGAEIGGHSGDATPAAKLIASTCDKLFIHPNVVNAADINEMTNNMLYVEGSILDRFLEGQIGLEEVYNNKILGDYVCFLWYVERRMLLRIMERFQTVS